MFFNQAIQLSIEDYKNHIEPIITSKFHNQRLEVLQEKYLKEQCIRKKEIYLLFKVILSFYFDLSLDQKNPFGAMVVNQRGDNSGRPTDIPENHQEFLQKIVNAISVPSIQARVADILWIIGKNNKQENAKIAIKGYMLTIEKIFEQDDRESPERLFECIQRVLFFSDLTKNEVNYINLKNLIIEHKDRIPPSDMIKIVSLLITLKTDRDLLLNCIKDKISISNDPFNWQELANIYYKCGDQKEAQQCKIKQAEIYAQRGDDMKNSDPFNARYWYAESLKNYPNTRNTKDRIMEINANLAQASSNSLKEMRPIKTDMPSNISKQIMEWKTKTEEEIKNKISNLPFLEALKKLALDMPRFSYEELEKLVEDEKDNCFGMSSSIVDHWRSTTVNSQVRCEPMVFTKDAEENSALYFKSKEFPYFHLRLDPIINGLEIIRMEHAHVTENDWYDLLKECSFIPKNRLQSYQLGLHNWFNRKNFIALPILIPQFENSVRFLIQNGGTDTCIYRGNEQRQEEQPFDKNLDHEIIKEAFGTDIVILLKALLTKKNGFSLRHKLAHGLIDDKHFFLREIEYFFLLLLSLIIQFSKNREI